MIDVVDTDMCGWISFPSPAGSHFEWALDSTSPRVEIAGEELLFVTMEACKCVRIN